MRLALISLLMIPLVVGCEPPEPPEPIPALRYVTQLAETGDVKAQYLLGIAKPYSNADSFWGALYDEKSGTKWLEAAAAQGMHQAGWIAGELAYPEENTKSKRLLVEAVDNGSPCMAQFSLAMINLYEGNYEEGLGWLNKTQEAAFESKNRGPDLIWPVQATEIVPEPGNLPFEQNLSNWTVCKSWAFRAMLDKALINLDFGYDAGNEQEFVSGLKAVANHPDARRTKRYEGVWKATRTYDYATNLKHRSNCDFRYEGCIQITEDIWSRSPKNLKLHYLSAAFEAAEHLAKHHAVKATRKTKSFRHGTLMVPIYDRRRIRRAKSPDDMKEAIAWTEFQIELLESNELPTENPEREEKLSRLKSQVPKMKALLPATP